MPLALWVAIFGTAAGFYAWQARQRAIAAAAFQTSGDAPADAFSANAPDWSQTILYDVQSLIGLNPDVSPAMLAYIRATEDFSAVPYLDPPGNSEGRYSIGYGHQIKSGDPYWPAGALMSINQDQGVALFERDVAAAESAVLRLVTVPLTQGQFDALVDFVYNFGQTKFASSTLLKFLNAGNYAGAAAEFRKWVFSGGRVSDALVARRDYEAHLFVGATA